MLDVTANYACWDNESLIHGFNSKSVASFFESETRFLDAIDVPALDGVLDVGCSCGRFIELLRSRHYRSHYTGVDVSERSIQIGRHNYERPDVTFFAGNYLAFPPDSTYDLINATGVVQHEPNYPKVIEKMVRDSRRYVLFDVKLANTPAPVVDVERCYCQVDTSRIHMICFSFRHVMDLVLQLPECGEVSAFGYHTRPNSATRGPADLIDNWASCGVFIDKAKPRGFGNVMLPADISLA